MVILKKIRSASLVEALVATLLVVIIFVTASLVLNNLLLNTFSKNTHSVETRMNEIEYEVRNGHIRIPYEETFDRWTITVKTEQAKSVKILAIIASDNNNGKEITRKRIYDK